MTTLVPVPVPGAADLMAMQDDGQVWVALRPMCDTLGISFDAQFRKLSRRSWAGIAQKATPSGGGVQMTTVIESRAVPLWLATIDENRVNADARAKLVAYQREAATALDAYFNKRSITAPTVNQFDVLRAAIDQIEAAQRTATQAKTTADRAEARLDAMEGRHGWFSALGYALFRGLRTEKSCLQVLGKRAASLARAEGITPGRIQHDHYGLVNSFPEWVWDAVVEER